MPHAVCREFGRLAGPRAVEPTQRTPRTLDRAGVFPSKGLGRDAPEIVVGNDQQRCAIAPYGRRAVQSHGSTRRRVGVLPTRKVASGADARPRVCAAR